MPIEAAPGSRWTRTESRRVRPFRDMRDYLRDSALRLHSDDEFTVNETLRADQVDASRLEPAILPCLPNVDISEHVGIPADSLSFVVIVEDSFIKKSTILYQSRLDNSIDDSITFDPERIRQTATWGVDTKIHLAVVLTENRESAPGVANRAGSWIAKKTFRLARDISLSRFPIEPVGKDWFVRFGLPADTTYFVWVRNPTGFNDPTAELQDVVEVKINESLAAALVRDENSLTSRAIVTNIYTDIVTTILSVGISEVDEGASPDTVLEAAVERLAQRTGLSPQTIYDWARLPDDNRLRAAVQAEAELTRRLISAARRRPM
jgi:hypothetical protein